MHRAITAAIILAAATPLFAHGEPDLFMAQLTGDQLVPAVNTMATGMVQFQLDHDILDLTVTFSGLSSPLNAAHIHCCAGFGENSGVAIDFFPDPETSGTFMRSYNLMDASIYTAGFLVEYGGLSGARAALLTAFGSENAYVVLHTGQFPAGELRGQIVAGAVPEPASWAMMIAGFGLVGGLARRRAPALASV